MRQYSFLRGSLEDFARAGLRVLTPETAQRVALQVDGEYPEREALLLPLEDDLWQVLPVGDCDWCAEFKRRGMLYYEDAAALEKALPAKGQAHFAVLDTRTKERTEKRKLPCVLCGDKPNLPDAQAVSKKKAVTRVTR